MNRRTTFSRHPARRRHAQLAGLALLLAATASQAATTMHPDELIDAARGFLEQAVDNYLQRGELQGRHEIQVNRLDPRLRLARCDIPLVVQLEGNKQPIGRVTLRVSCTGSALWSVFVPAQVRLYRQVIVTSRALQRGSALGPGDLGLAEHDVSLLAQGYLTDTAEVLGNKLTRLAQAGQPLTPSMLELAEVVRKGDQVVISSGNGSVSVRMPGEALDDGAPNQQIRVKNLRSGRIVRARVAGPGQVEVAM